MANITDRLTQHPFQPSGKSLFFLVWKAVGYIPRLHCHCSTCTRLGCKAKSCEMVAVHRETGPPASMVVKVMIGFPQWLWGTSGVQNQVY